jgi:hypothetical protein
LYPVWQEHFSLMLSGFLTDAAYHELGVGLAAEASVPASASGPLQ